MIADINDEDELWTGAYMLAAALILFRCADKIGPNSHTLIDGQARAIATTVVETVKERAEVRKKRLKKAGR